MRMGKTKTEFREGRPCDLEGLYALFEELICFMHTHGNNIWNEVYPAMCFEEDIRQGQLYVLEEDGRLVSAIAFSTAPDGEENVVWKGADSEAVYLSRLGVIPSMQGRGLGAGMLRNMARVAAERGHSVLRCYAVDTNQNAIRLYEQLGFERAEGYRFERLPDRVLTEYGYEIKTERLSMAKEE